MIRFLLVVVLIPLTASAAEPADPLTTAVAEFRAAYRAWDGDGFSRAAATAAQAPPRAVSLYWRGVIEFHRLLFLLGSGEEETAANRRAADSALESAVAALQEAVERNPQHGESRALLSATYGLSIGAHPVRALWLGPRLVDQEKRARRLDPKNPRVLYLAGLNRYYGPSILGGQKEALGLLHEAAKQFAVEAAENADALAPRWGHGGCLVYIGKTNKALGETETAAEYFRRALVLNPQDQLAREEREKLTK